MTKQLQSQLALVQWYYHFLALGMWMGDFIKQQNMSSSVRDMVVARDGSQDFLFSKETLSVLLSSAHTHADQENIMEYMTFLNGVRGVIMTTHEMLDGSSRYHQYVFGLLGDQFREFEYLIRWLRNVLVHMTDPRIMVSHDGFRAIQDIDADWKYIDLDVKPQKLWSDHDGDYRVRVHVDLATIKHNTRLRSIISEYQLYAIANMCYDMARKYN